MSEPRDNCQCAIVPIGHGVTIEFCPMHDAAPELLESVKALVRRVGFSGAMKCLFDNLNPCWDNRPSDKPGLHWGATADNRIRACELCNARAVIAKAESTPPGRADQTPDPTQPTEAKEK
jgi:hypothetical protein